MDDSVSPRQQNIPLIIEPHPVDYTGYPFIALIQYRKEHVLTIIDNIDEREVKAYVLDLCGPADVAESMIIDVATQWYDSAKNRHPLSVEFSRRGMVVEVSKVYRSFATEFITRIIGPVSQFPMFEVKSTKRRRKRAIPPSLLNITED
jgi:hypothetical protein